MIRNTFHKGVFRSQETKSLIEFEMNLLSFFDDVTGTWNFWAEISEGLKNNQWDSLYFHKKVHKNIFNLLKDTQNKPFSLTQCCLKPEKGMSDSADQEL